MAYPHLNIINPETVTFEKLYFGASAAVSAAVLRSLASVHRDHTLGHARIQQELSHVSDQLLLSIQSWVLKDLHVEKTNASPVTVPTTWWDHLKHDMLASKKSWVVWVAELFKAPNYTTIFREEVHTTRVCPHNDTYFSENQQHMNWMLWREDNGNRLEERD